MNLTPNLAFVIEVLFAMLVCCWAQEDSVRSSLRLKESAIGTPYIYGKDISQEQLYSFEKDIIQGSPDFDSSGNAYRSVGKLNRRCKSALCINISGRSRRHHHHKKQHAYHSRNTYHNHKISPLAHRAPIESQQTDRQVSDDKLATTQATVSALSTSTRTANRLSVKLINSTEDRIASSEVKFNETRPKTDSAFGGNKQKIIDSKVLSARKDLSNFFPNHVSGLKKNFARYNPLNQTEVKSQTLDESIKQILHPEDLSLYFPSKNISKPADTHSSVENQLLTSLPDKKINYQHAVWDFDHRRNNSRNSSDELSSITRKKSEEKTPPNEKNQSNKLSKLITANAPGIQYRTEQKAMFINKKYNSSPTTDDPLERNEFANDIKNSLAQKNTYYASYLRQKTNPVTKPPADPDQQCYSVGDLLMVVLITSLANLFAGFILTLTFCCVSPRLRLLSSFRRTTESYSIGITHSRLNLSEEEISGNVGCLEACLPDISYQRHVARDTPKLAKRKLNSCFQHFQTRKKGTNVYQPGGRGYSSLHRADQSPLVERKSVSLEDLRIT